MPKYVYAKKFPDGINLRDREGKELTTISGGVKLEVAGDGGDRYQVFGTVAKVSVLDAPPDDEPGDEGGVKPDLPTMTWPVLGREHVVTDVFNRPRGYANRKHEGCDLRGHVGDQVVPVYDGVVIETRTTGYSDASYGRYVLIEHNIGGKLYRTQYCHLNSVAASVGQHVKAGETVIGASGNSGTDAAHLHLNLIDTVLAATDGRGYFVKGVINPQPYLPQLYTVL